MISQWLAEADMAVEKGQLDTAQRLCNSILSKEPGNLTAHLLIGVIAVKSGQFAAAAPILQHVAREDANCGKAHLWLSRALRRLNRGSEATVSAVRAVECEPGSPSAHHQLGACHLEAHRFEAAADCFRQAIRLDPKAPSLYFGLAAALQGIGNSPEAIRVLQRASELDPQSTTICERLFQALADESDSAGALACARKLLSLQPNNPRFMLNLARALVADNKASEAREHLDRAISQAVPDAEFAFSAGTVAQSLGRIDDAEKLFRSSIEMSPLQGTAYAALAYNRKADASVQALTEQMRAAGRSDQLSPEEHAFVHYALGKVAEDLGEYEQAMNEFDEANRLAYISKFGQRELDKEAYVKQVDAVIADLDQQSHSSDGSESSVPIFVLGMPRSGTTLAEQILSSHPAIGAGGEQGFWLHHRGAALAPDGLTIDDSKLSALTDRYLDLLTQMWPSKAHVVDKMPDNYREIGLIHRALPKAKIIHCKRHPVDTCISIYTTINRLRLPWAHNKQNIVFMYEQYVRLMQHWRQILPPGTMMDLSYEEVVGDRERVTRKLIEFCGLDWNEACLRPEQNSRAVSTPSVWQVRQPVYKTSIERWKNYEPWLGEFHSLIGNS